MIQITQKGVLAQDVDIDGMQAIYAERGSLVLPNLFAPELLDYLLRKIAATTFVLKHEGAVANGTGHYEHHDDHEFGTTLFMPTTESAYFLFHLLINKLALFRLVEQITGCGPIGNIMGRIHRTVANENQHIDWHDDIADTRLVGLNVNLSSEDYQGGLFQLRDKASQCPLGEYGNVGMGSAILFRISPEVEHRLTPVEGGSRTVGVGWFRAQPSWPIFAPAFFRPHQ